MASPHMCYVLVNAKGHTYNGYTVNLNRRLRQHNGELVGGARSTSGKGPWSVLLCAESPDLTQRSALSLEWSIRYPTNKKPRPRHLHGPEGRLNSLPWVLSNPKFAGLRLVIRVVPEYLAQVKALCDPFPNVEVAELGAAVE